jgi:hypothetical protein
MSGEFLDAEERHRIRPKSCPLPPSDPLADSPPHLTSAGGRKGQRVPARSTAFCRTVNVLYRHRNRSFMRIATVKKPYWRSATIADLDAINDIGDEIHLTLPERAEVFAEKFYLFPQGCFIFTQSGRVLGYGLSHPWILYEIPKLDTLLGRLPPRPDCLFIHDVAIRSEGRGYGGAGDYVQLAVSIARLRKLPSLALVSVYDTNSLWSRFGFNIVPRPELDDKLKVYGESARYMARTVT